MKRTQRAIISFLLACSLICLPVLAAAAESYDTTEDWSSQILYPGDDLTGIGEGVSVIKDGENIAVEDGTWTNDEDGAVYQASKENSIIELTALGYSLTVVHGSSVGEDESEETCYQSGETVTIIAEDPVDGYEFVRWSFDEPGLIEDPDSAETTLTMPAESLTVRAVFEEKEDSSDSKSKDLSESETETLSETEEELEDESETDDWEERKASVSGTAEVQTEEEETVPASNEEDTESETESEPEDADTDEISGSPMLSGITNGQLIEPFTLSEDGTYYFFTVSSEAPEDGNNYIFIKWTATYGSEGIPIVSLGGDTGLASDATLTVPADIGPVEISVMANYTESYQLIIEGGYVMDGVYDFLPGEDVDVTVAAQVDDAMEFGYWELSTDPQLEDGFIETLRGFDCDQEEINLSFKMPSANVILTAFYEIPAETENMETAEVSESKEGTETAEEPESIENTEGPETEEPESRTDTEVPEEPESAEITEAAEEPESMGNNTEGPETEEPESMENTESPETEEPESMADTEMPEEPESMTDTEVAEEPESAEITEAAEEPESMENTEGPETEEAESMSETEMPEEPESMADTEVAEEPESAENTEAAEEPESAEITEAAEEPESMENTEGPETEEAESMSDTEVPEEPESMAETEEPESMAETEVPEPESSVDTEAAEEPESMDTAENTETEEPESLETEEPESMSDTEAPEEESESMADTEAPEEPESPENTAAAEESESIDTAESTETEESESMDTAESTETEEPESLETEEPESVGDTEVPEEPESPENTAAAEEPESMENTESTEAAEEQTDAALPTYHVMVDNGTPDQVEYHAGDIVTITSNYPAANKEFQVWSVISGDVIFANASRAVTTFTMPESDVTVSASYKDGPENYIEGITEGASYESEEKLTFTPVGGGMENTNPNPGDIRYIPASYQIGNVANTWTSAPYTTSMSIKKSGEYTLTVSFTKQVWNGSSWSNDGAASNAAVTFYIAASANLSGTNGANTTNSANGTGGGSDTGDTTPVNLVIVIAVIACIVFIILLVLFIRRRRNRNR